ncbi:hypothetical protein F0562_008833 [Nyssa sinensis]|uniref:Uncharacterized protein n=1 Tax=Nyssa sinensis TaxID=561372 RepID=A0A5J5AA79_9ASTE|nr:hypothetical protein F0562_008833 [Nyssa sinensis]
MESILARALEYTLKYWLKSFSRDQFKLQGRTVQLSNLDINGDALHASLGLPPALNVSAAKVGKLVITLPSVSNVQVEPIVVQIDRLDLVLEENEDLDASRSTSSAQSSTSSGRGSGYGFADKIADGMTLEVHTVNLLLETHGGARGRAGATWASPMASITMRNLILYTTNERWQVVNLKEARDFSSNLKFIYVFKKLEWEYLSIDLLPHPDMFTDAHFACSQDGSNRKDDDGAKRVFFGGERFIDGITGQAYITVQRTELNSPLGLEVQLHITEAVCPALSEPGLRALLRFLTGLYVCLNRGDVNPNAQQCSTEAAGRSLVSITVDHIFLCIKDAEFQLELLMQSLLFSRASVSDGEIARYLTRVMIGGLFLRDTFSRPPCTLVQPSMQAATEDLLAIPDFGKNFCPPIYPLGDSKWQLNEGLPLICLHSLQIKPSPASPSFASETVIDCQPLMISLQEESCLRISSFLADGIVVNPGAVLPDSSVNSLIFNLKGLDITVPLDMGKTNYPESGNAAFQSSFVGARLHIQNLFFLESPSIKLKLLNLEKDPACFCLWEDQPIDASQKKWTIGASLLDLSLETCNGSTGVQNSLISSSGLWRCVELKDACIEVAMATADGSSLINVPPPGGVVRVGVACQQYFSNTSVEQLFFVLELYAYFGRITEKIAIAGKNSRPNKKQNESSGGRLIEKVPSDTAISLAVMHLQLRFLESSSIVIQGMPLVQFIGDDLFIKVSHRTLGGAIAISSSIRWESVQVDCADTEGNLAHENGTLFTSIENGLLISGNDHPQLRAVLWVQNRRNHHSNGNVLSVPFLDISSVHVIPYNAQDMECHSLSVAASIAGVRLGGGMNYAEALLHRFGILGPDGGPGEGLSKGLENLSAGPLSKLFKASPLFVDSLKEYGNAGDVKDDGFLHLGTPDDLDVSIELKDWLLALEGAQEMAESPWLCNHENFGREERCWHTTFQSLQVKAKSSQKHVANGKGKFHGMQKCPIELVTVGVVGLRTLKPQAPKGILQNGLPVKGLKPIGETYGGINLGVDIAISEDDADDGMANWVVENLKFSVKQPIEAVVKKDELEHLAILCKSEVDSMGRIAAGVLRVLKLEGSVGQAAINQLSNLGTEGFDKIFNPEKLSRGSSVGSTGFSPSSNVNNESLLPTLETLASLEQLVLDSQAECAALTAEFCGSESSMQHRANVKQLTQKLESMQCLLARLRTQI